MRVSVTHPEAGTHDYPGMLWRMSETSAQIRTPLCCLGEHNAYVYGDVLGYSADGIARLTRDGHIGDTYV